MFDQDLGVGQLFWRQVPSESMPDRNRDEPEAERPTLRKNQTFGNAFGSPAKKHYVVPDWDAACLAQQAPKRDKT